MFRSWINLRISGNASKRATAGSAAHPSGSFAPEDTLFFVKFGFRVHCLGLNGRTKCTVCPGGRSDSEPVMIQGKTAWGKPHPPGEVFGKSRIPGNPSRATAGSAALLGSSFAPGGLGRRPHPPPYPNRWEGGCASLTNPCMMDRGLRVEYGMR